MNIVQTEDIKVTHADGVAWHAAPLPPFEHDCKPQTTGWIGFDYIERCACGAGRMGTRRPWINKNETRILRGETPPRQPRPWGRPAGLIAAGVTAWALYGWLLAADHVALAFLLQGATLVWACWIGYRSR